jgi:hypothetical protein
VSGSFDRSALELRAQRSSSPFCTFARPSNPFGTAATMMDGDGGGVYFRLSAVAFCFLPFLHSTEFSLSSPPSVFSFKRFICQCLSSGPDLQNSMLTDTYT